VARERALRSLPCKRYLPLLTGTTHFVDDLNHPGALQACPLCSRVPTRGSFRSGAHRDVADVVRARDLPFGTCRIPMRMYLRPGMDRLLQPLLADGVV
jgi:hypothetical protein